MNLTSVWKSAVVFVGVLLLSRNIYVLTHQNSNSTSNSNNQPQDFPESVLDSPVSDVDLLSEQLNTKKGPLPFNKSNPAARIFFAKTPHSAGATLQNIFFRHGFEEKLLFGLPKSLFSGKGVKESFKPGFNRGRLFEITDVYPIDETDLYNEEFRQRFDMIVHPMMVSNKHVEAIMPKKSDDNDEKEKFLKITSLRDPVSFFTTMFVHHANDFKLIENSAITADVDFESFKQGTMSDEEFKGTIAAFLQHPSFYFTKVKEIFFVNL